MIESLLVAVGLLAGMTSMRLYLHRKKKFTPEDSSVGIARYQEHKRDHHA